MNDSRDESTSPESPKIPHPKGPGCFRLRTILWTIVLLGIAISLFLPAVRTASGAARRAQCVNNLKQISLALANYADEYGSLPPAYIAAADGMPMHSWRVLILPFMGNPELQKLYDQYRFDEPWDGPNNRQLANRMPYAYRCPGVDGRGWFDTSPKVPPGYTQYLALTGEMAAFPGRRSLKIDEITDGTSNTMAIVELDKATGVPWMAPCDIDWAGFFTILSDMNEGRKQHAGGTNAAFADGSVKFLKGSIDRQTLYRLMTVNGGETISSDAY